MIRPRKKPCASCPYRRDCPSGLWAEHEYGKLADYDKPTWDQPPVIFACHLSAGDEACAGWVACHDMHENLGLRLEVLKRTADADAFLGYTTEVPVFTSGAEAAEHGKREIGNPTPRARAAIARIIRQRTATERPIRYG
jgi:Family of unknown function (DUF6283)